MINEKLLNSLGLMHGKNIETTFYQALAMFLQCHPNDLKAMVLSYFDLNLNEFRYNLIARYNKTYERFCADKKDGKEWIDIVEIEILMQQLKKQIIIIDEYGKIKNINKLSVLKTDIEEPIFIYYGGVGKYLLLIRHSKISLGVLFNRLKYINSNIIYRDTFVKESFILSKQNIRYCLKYNINSKKNNNSYNKIQLKSYIHLLKRYGGLSNQGHIISRSNIHKLTKKSKNRQKLDSTATVYIWNRDSLGTILSRTKNYVIAVLIHRIYISLNVIFGDYVKSNEEVKIASENVLLTYNILLNSYVGHTSLMTYDHRDRNGIYASLWPKDPSITFTDAKGVESQMHTYKEDMQYYKNERAKLGNNDYHGEADKIITLYNLDVREVKLLFEYFKANKTKINWSLMGSFHFFDSDNSYQFDLKSFLIDSDYTGDINKIIAFNCASFVKTLLIAGGMNEEINEGYYLRFNDRLAAKYGVYTGFVLSTITISFIQYYIKNNLFSALTSLSTIISFSLSCLRNSLMYLMGSLLIMFSMSYALLKILPCKKYEHDIQYSIKETRFGSVLAVSIWASIEGMKFALEQDYNKQINLGNGLGRIQIAISSMPTILCYIFSYLALIYFLPKILGSNIKYINYIGSLAGLLSEETGLVLTPEGIFNLSNYIKKVEKEQDSLNKNVNEDDLFFAGIRNDILHLCISCPLAIFISAIGVYTLCNQAGINEIPSFNKEITNFIINTCYFSYFTFMLLTSSYILANEVDIAQAANQSLNPFRRMKNTLFFCSNHSINNNHNSQPYMMATVPNSASNSTRELINTTHLDKINDKKSVNRKESTHTAHHSRKHRLNYFFKYFTRLDHSKLNNQQAKNVSYVPSNTDSATRSSKSI